MCNILVPAADLAGREERLMTMESVAPPTPMGEVDVAVIGAGPCRADDGESAWSGRRQGRCSGVRRGLRGIPRAIAYDAETLRLFSLVGLFDAVAPELVQSPHIRHVNARGRTLMAADFPASRTLTAIPLSASSTSRSSSKCCSMDCRGSPASRCCSDTWRRVCSRS